MSDISGFTPQKKKIVLSCAQPSGKMTLGNYLGALKNWAAMQDDYNSLFAVADLHAITVRQDPKVFKEQIYQALATLLACGIDPKKSVVFVQSQVHEHAELSWILSCYAMFGELSRMTQFKDKSAKYSDNVNAGLFTYPVLMAADILLYQSDYVPVGQDQKQHLEIARDIAGRFNSMHGNTFTLPEPYIGKTGAKIMSLLDPQKKMSKSDENPGAYISIFDEDGTIIKKFKRAVTDSGSEVRRGADKAGINNLIAIYSAVTGMTEEQVEAAFEGKGYGDFKTACGEAVAREIGPIRDKINDFMKNKDYLEQVMQTGGQQAQVYAARTLDKVYKKLGFVRKSF